MLTIYGYGSIKMKNWSNNVKNPKVTCPNLLAVIALTTYALSCLGCEETLKNRNDWPLTISVDTLTPDAARIITDSLADPDPLIRANAIEVVAKTKQVRLMPKVQRLMKDQSAPVRFAAALAVGDLEYALAKDSVTELLQDQNENVKIAALYALGKLGQTDRIDQLRKAITSSDQTLRANAALLLGKSSDTSTLTSQALWWTLRREDSDDKVRFQTAEALAMLGDERIYPKLWTMLISAYADDRVMGIKAMRQLGTLQARDAIITMLDDEVIEVRLTAAEQLGMLKDTRAEPVVLDVFTRDLAAGLDKQSRTRVNVRLALAIGQIGSQSLIRFLPQLLKDESKFVRLAAAMAVFQCQMKK
jgi:HEAT repeat protein